MKGLNSELKKAEEQRWQGIRPAAKRKLAMRDYSSGTLAERLGTTGVMASALIDAKDEISEAWIPGVEVFARKVFQQKGRGYFAELARSSEGAMGRIGLAPKQWATALMHRATAKGFHIHPPHIPDGTTPENWLRRLYLEEPENYGLRPYDNEQWDVMFFLTGICEMILVDERAGLPRRIMRFVIAGDSRPGPDNAAVVIPPGVGHGLINLGNEDLIMVYGTSTVFNPHWEGRIESGLEQSRLPEEWTRYLATEE